MLANVAELLEVRSLLRSCPWGQTGSGSSTVKNRVNLTGASSREILPTRRLAGRRGFGARTPGRESSPLEGPCHPSGTRTISVLHDMYAIII